MRLTSGTDQNYWKAIQTGDRHSLEQVYTDFAPSIQRLVRNKGGSIEDARDVFQSALIVLFELNRSGKLNTEGAFGGLLHQICRNIWGNRLQKKSFQEVSIPEDIKYSLEDPWKNQIEEEEKRQLLRDQMKQLGNDCRRLLQLFFEGKSMEEIRQYMGYGSTSYASKRKFGCKEQLVQLIKKDRRFQELKF